VAANNSLLNLPAATFGWAGLLGLLVGLRASRAEDRGVPGHERRVTGVEDGSQHTSHVARYRLRSMLWVLLAVSLGLLLLLSVLGTLPPLGLIAQDARALLGWLEHIARRALESINPFPAAPALDEGEAPGLPVSRTWLFMGEALPRAWGELLTAPSSGERGARLLVAFGGVTSAWIGAIMLGLGLGRRRALAGWSLPLLGALTFTSTLGGGSAMPLIIGIALLLLLGMAADVRGREIVWDRAGVDFPGEQLGDILMWGGTLATIIVLLAAILPAWLNNPIATAIWPEVEVPSGLAVLERNLRAQRGPPTVDPGISSLPALQLGVSLEAAPPDTIALHVRLAGPNGSAAQLPAAPWPRYWRARVFTIYDGRGWTQNARISPYDASEPQPGLIPGAIVQEIEDARPERGLLFGLPSIVGVNVPANVERLADGELAALTSRAPAGRYRVVSRPQELAEAPIDQPPPDMRGYLGLPSNIPPQIGEAARAQVGGLAGSYEQALALEQFLRELPYSYQVQPLPGGGDAVYQFLFQMRSGYCTYYASAMAVMARSLGIPARVATGYATGTYDPAAGVYIVHEADAHAWPELYINGRWLPFEPTPVRPLPARSAAVEQSAVPVPAEELQPSGMRGPLIWLAVLVALGLLTAGGILLGRRPAPAPLVAQVQLRLERNGARAGVPWPPGATLHEYGALLEPRLDGAAEALREVVELVAQARYGHHALRADEELRLRAAEERVWAQLRRSDRRA
ncbi:MAG TPA: transglutaminaseTgpA domain-containing protein, partial [Roseiflexaceae bacterium]|nr:transglutaminaseTgpA domain-containing protein [Roseiflexaceae bacterium]